MCLVFRQVKKFFKQEEIDVITMIYTPTNSSSQHCEGQNDTQHLLGVTYIYSVMPPPNNQD